MKTQNKDKIKKAKELMFLIEKRKEIEKEEQDLKNYFKDEIQSGVLEAGNIVIMVEEKQRVSLDKEALEIDLGDKVKKYERITVFKQVNVKEIKAG